MLLVLLLSAVMTVALPSSRSEDEDRVIDLQELLLNVSDSYRDFGRGIESLGAVITGNVKLIVDNVNANARRSDANVKIIVENIKASAQKSDVNAERAKEISNANVNLLIENVNANARRAEEIANVNVKLLVENFNAERSNADVKLLVESVNADAKRNEEIAKANAKLILENNEKVKENTDILKQILKALENKNPSRATDCSELFQQGERMSGKREIFISGTIPSMQHNVEVYCDMKTDGGGWTVFQRRGDYGNSQDYFAKTWVEYKNGFGELDKEFWLGNDWISALTQQKPYSLRVDLWDSEGNHGFANYHVFKVDNEKRLYKISIDGYSGNAGDSAFKRGSIRNMNGMSFSTKDMDNDGNSTVNCSTKEGGGGGWWFNNCNNANLNGLNLRKVSKDGAGIVWFRWKGSWYSMAFAEMKIRPANFYSSSLGHTRNDVSENVATANY